MNGLVTHLEREVQEARKRGDLPALLEVASAARRIGYKAAADVWPGWEVGAPPRSDAELEAAQALARRSSVFVDLLGLNAIARGNAIWLIGAFDLARGRYEEALNGFAAAAGFYADAPAMELLCEGYMANVLRHQTRGSFETNCRLPGKYSVPHRQGKSHILRSRAHSGRC